MLIQIAISLPFVLWLILRFTLGAGPYKMDPCGKGTFFPHLITYSVFGYAQVVLGVIGATWAYGYDAKMPAGILLTAAIFALLFVGFIAFFYEGYMHGMANPPGVSNYTIGKYAAVLSLGVSSVLLLIAGAVWTAVELGR